MPSRLSSNSSRRERWLLTALIFSFLVSSYCLVSSSISLVNRLGYIADVQVLQERLERDRIRASDQFRIFVSTKSEQAYADYRASKSDFHEDITTFERYITSLTGDEAEQISSELERFKEDHNAIEKQDDTAVEAILNGDDAQANRYAYSEDFFQSRYQFSQRSQALMSAVSAAMTGLKDRSIRWSAFVLMLVCLSTVGMLSIFRWRLRKEQVKSYHYQSEIRRLALVAERTSNGVVITNSSGVIEWCNNGFLTMTGYSMEETLGKKPGQFLQGPNTDKLTVEKMRDAVASRHAFKETVLNYRKDGTPFWDEIEAQPLYDDKGAFAGFMGIQNDVTERVTLVDSLRVEQLRLEMALSAGELGHWDWNIADNHVYYSNRYFTMLGYDSGADFEESINTCLSLTHPDDLEKKWQAAEAHLRGETENYDIETRLRRADGSYAWIQTRGKVYARDSLGQPLKMSGTHLDITQRRSYEEELARRHDLLENVINGVSDAIIIVDFERQILRCNRAATKLFGYAEEELIGQNASMLFENQQEFQSLGKKRVQLHSGISSDTSIVVYQRKDGSTFPGETIGTLLKDRLGVKQGHIGVIRDVTNRLKVEEDLRRAKDQAEQANRMKSEFLANMSHEIRTPMTAILGFADLLEHADREGNIDTQAEMVQTIRRNGEHLLQVINDILDLSKIEAGFLELSPGSCRVRHIANDVISTLSPRAKDKGIELDCQIDDRVPEEIDTDPTRLRQILFNIVGNGVKFTSEGSVWLKIRFESDIDASNAKKATGKLIIDIRDTGIGMNSEQIEKIFVPFCQGESGMSRRYGGTGLGLTIVKRLAESMHGDVKVISQPGQGSQFLIDLQVGFTPAKNLGENCDGCHRIGNECRPVEAHTCLQKAQELTSMSPFQDLKGLNVMLVEDGVDNQRLVSFLLKKAGAEVEICENGQVALDRIAQRNGDSESLASDIDVVFMDMQMPIKDGYTATRELRDSGFHKPIIALTAHAMQGDREKCLQAGCDDFLTKPVNKQTLLHACKSWAQRSEECRLNQVTLP